MKRKNVTRSLRPTPILILRTRDGNIVSCIGMWICRLGLGLTHNGHVIHWRAAICIFCLIIITASQVITLIQAADDSAKMFECLSVITFCGLGLLKLHSLRRRRQRWYSLLSKATDLEIQQLNYEDPLNVDYESDDESDNVLLFKRHIENYTQKFISTSKLLCRIYIATVSIYSLSPFIEYAIWKIQGADTFHYPHILPVWTTLEEAYFPFYIITILAEGMGSFFCTSVHMVFDLTVVGMMIFIHGQFLTLRDSCERIGGEGRKCNLSKKRDLRAHFRITRCQRIHASLIKSVKELSSLTEDILGIYFNIATLTLCSVAIQVLWNELSTTQLLTLVQYMCASLIQLFFFCYYGDGVINESSLSIGEGPSACAWWCLSPWIRREVALLTLSMTRRCRLSAGPFHIVNLPAFIQIARTTYSFFAVIRQKSVN